MNRILRKWDSLHESAYRVNLQIDNLPIRSGGGEDFPPQLTIVIPVYNVDSWLGDCLRSLQAQTFTAWEAILVDDGSTDFSGVICDNFAKRDLRLKVIHQKNRGVSSARNAGLAIARAKWLSFVDPDDLLPENYYASMLQFANKTGSKWVASNCLFFGEGAAWETVNKTLCVRDIRKTIVCSTENEIKNHFYKLLPGGGWGFVCDRETWGDTLFPENVNIAEDMLAYMEVLPRVQTAAYLAEVNYYYRQRAGSLLTRPMDIDRYKQLVEAANKTVEVVSADNQSFTETIKDFQMTLELKHLLVAAIEQRRKEKRCGMARAIYEILAESGNMDLLDDLWSLLVNEGYKGG